MKFPTRLTPSAGADDDGGIGKAGVEGEHAGIAAGLSFSGADGDGVDIEQVGGAEFQGGLGDVAAAGDAGESGESDAEGSGGDGVGIAEDEWFRRRR